MTPTQSKDLEAAFEHMHKNPTAPFNEFYSAEKSAKCSAVIQSMEDDGFYDVHTREECAEEIKRRMSML